MNIKQKISSLIFIFSTIAAGIALQPSLVSAAGSSCGGVETSIITCPQTKDPKTAQDSAVWGILLIVLNIMTAGIGIAAVGGIVFGSILYASAGDKAEQTKRAITIITNVVIGLVAYGLMYLVLNFLIPGGIFK